MPSGFCALGTLRGAAGMGVDEGPGKERISRISAPLAAIVLYRPKNFRCEVAELQWFCRGLKLSILPKMLSAFNITFLGTASAQPSSTRNHSSLALRLGSDVWLFDCGESTQKQIQASKGIRMGRIRKIFITHTHGKLNSCWFCKKLT